MGVNDSKNPVKLCKNAVSGTVVSWNRRCELVQTLKQLKLLMQETHYRKVEGEQQERSYCDSVAYMIVQFSRQNTCLGGIIQVEYLRYECKSHFHHN